MADVFEKRALHKLMILGDIQLKRPERAKCANNVNQAGHGERIHNQSDDRQHVKLNVIYKSKYDAAQINEALHNN
ncbi:hypothetical protein D3C80_2103470 [compost metagenome]